jgi:thiol-disulfide isomerase/thioredoxin
MNKLSILFSLFLFFNQPLSAKENILQLIISGKNYEALQLKMTLSSNTSIYIPGNNSGNNLWEFQLSDNIYERSQNMILVVPSAKNIVHELALTYTMAKDTIRTVDFYIKKKFSKLMLEYINSHTEEKVNYLMYKDAIFDHFYATIDDSEFESNMMKLYTTYQFLINSYSYKEKLNRSISLVKKYPESHSLIAGLYTTLGNYKSKDDIETIFIHFSESQKNSYYGQLIQIYLYAKTLPNIQLQLLNEDRMESVISDTKRDNLIIFTASWCQPCHALIPILKVLHAKLKDKLTFTYISIDDSRTIDKWAKVIRENKIPWRCLAAINKLDEVMKLYTIKEIPLAYHVSADGSFKEIRLQNAEERDKLLGKYFPNKPVQGFCKKNN